MLDVKAIDLYYLPGGRESAGCFESREARDPLEGLWRQAAGTAAAARSRVMRVRGGGCK